MCVCVCVCLCVYICVFFYVCVCACLVPAYCMRVCVCVCVCADRCPVCSGADARADACQSGCYRPGVGACRVALELAVVCVQIIVWGDFGLCGC